MRLIWLLLVVFLSMVPSRASADPASDAERHFKRARSFHKRGEYANALKELTAAYAAAPTPALLYGIAQTHVKLGQCAEANTFYQRFIDSKPSEEAVTRALAAMEACKTPGAPPGAPGGPSGSTASSPPEVTAKEHFARATSFHKQGDYTSALRELTSAYDAEPTPSLMYAIAQTHVKLGQCSEATTFYERFIDSKPKPDAVERAHAAIAACKASAPKAAAAAPATASKPVAPLAAADLKKAELRNTPVEIVRTEPPTKPVDIKAAAVAPMQPQRPELVRVDREDRYDRHPTRKWAYVGAGAGAGAMLVGTIFGSAADATQKSFDDAGCGDRAQVLGADATAQCLAFERRGARNVRIGNGFLIGGGGALALFAVLLIIDPGNIEHPKLEPPKLSGATVSVSTNSVHLSIPW